MDELKIKRNLSRTRTVRSVTGTMQPTVSKHFIDFQTDESETSGRKATSSWQRYPIRLRGTALDRIISKLKRDYKAEDILLIITPASQHENLYKLHVIEQGHLGVTTITQRELSRLKISNAFQKYRIVFVSRYINLKNVVLQLETIKTLVNRKCCKESKETLAPKTNSLNKSKSNASSAGDSNKNETVRAMKFQDSFIQTDPEIVDNISFSLNDIYSLIEIINHTLQPSKTDIERFFYMADKMNFSLVIRPVLLWKNSAVSDKDQENSNYFLVESYLPGNCYLGCIILFEHDLLQALDLSTKLLFSIHVIEDVYELTPLPKKYVNAMQTVFSVLKLELLYDALGELIFDWCKNFTFL